MLAMFNMLISSLSKLQAWVVIVWICLASWVLLACLVSTGRRLWMVFMYELDGFMTQLQDLNVPRHACIAGAVLL